MYLIAFTVPETHVEEVKTAMFNAGAGQQGAYSHCAWQTLGTGQFMPMEGNQAFIGETNTIETLPEYRVEMISDKQCIQEVVAALKQAHPYEVPYYQVITIEAI